MENAKQRPWLVSMITKQLCAVVVFFLNGLMERWILHREAYLIYFVPNQHFYNVVACGVGF